MVDFGDVISSSAKWAVKCLFRPFNFKKWLVLAFVALMAGCLGNGCNIPSGGGNHYENNRKDVCVAEVIKTPAPDRVSGKSCAPSSPESKYANTMSALITPITIAIIVSMLAVFIVFMWLSCRFIFIFLEGVIKDDASIAAPFSANKKEGNSLFKFDLSFTAIAILVIGLMVILGFLLFGTMPIFQKTSPSFSEVMQLLVALLPYLLVFIVAVIVAAIVMMIAEDFVVAVMFKEKIRFLQAWPKVMALLKKDVGSFVLYILIKMGLSLGANIVYFLLSLVSLLVLLIPGGLIGYVLYLVSKSITGGALIAYWVVVAVVATPICLFLLYCLMALYLPVAVFFRAFSVKFLGKLDPQYDLISQ